MKISELIAEAVAPIGSTTDQVSPDGLPKTGAPTTPGQPPAVQPALAGQTPPASQQPGQAASTLGNQAPAGSGQSMGQQPAALQQGMQTTMTDLDKIAAQIVGLKQKHQQMQQQMQQKPAV